MRSEAGEIVGERSRVASGAGEPRPLISFVVPAHDEEALLPRTLESLHAAARAAGVAYEIVVADDDSADATPRIAAERGARVERIAARCIAAARNAGASASSGEILVFVDADTVVPEETLAALVAAVERGAAGGGATVVFDGEIPLWARGFLFVLNPLMRRARLSGGCFLFARREAFDAAKGFDESVLVSEEIGFCRRLRRCGPFVVLRERVVTSGRKLRAHSFREILAALGAIALRGRAGARNRRLVGLWYGPRREDPGARLDLPPGR